jgi:endonuclease/exonuclease/phosphatase family metal-dependent hydrolase
MERVILEHTIRQPRALLLLCIFSVFLSGCEKEHVIDLQASNVFDRQQPTDIRVMSWNVKANSIFPPNGVRQESFARIVRAIDPYVIALQEVLKRELVAELMQLMNECIPLEDGDSWHVHRVSDNALVSRYPIRWQGGERAVPYPLPQFGLPDFHLGFASSLVDLPERFGATDMLLVAMHKKSGGDMEDVRQRQVHSDTVVRWMRELRDSGQNQAVADNTPVVILGDMNAVPNASLQPLETLLSGDIADEEAFGPDFKIDWDGTDMADANPSHNGLDREYYTWRNDEEPFPPSALDRVLFTDSVMSVRRGFVLNTMTMSPDNLEDLGLQQTDALYGEDPSYYDHLPLVVDFVIGSASSE